MLGGPSFWRRAVIGLLVGVTPRALPAQRGATGGEWRVWGGDHGATRYAPLDQIRADNVGRLQIVWRWTSENFGPRPEFKNSVTPIMVNGVLYATAGLRRAVVALDAETGETLWVYRLDEGRRGDNAPRPGSGRGVAYWSDTAGDERIFVITPGYHLVALDARTGVPIATFGRNGIVDLKLDLDREIDTLEARIGASSPPVVYRDLVIVGSALDPGLRPPSMRNVPGHVRAYDARTGRRRWIFHTIPQAGEYGVETWEDGSWAYTGNTAVWAPFTVDEELGYVYLPVEAATGDYYGGHRPGENLFSSSLVCLDALTGRRIWHYQIVHHDIWDYDNTAAPILTDIPADGGRIRAVVQLTKQSFAYVFDRVTGRPLWPIEERPVPQSDVPGERTSPTQPVPARPPPFDRQGVTVDDLIDFTPELRQAAIELIRPYRLGPLFAPPSLADAPDGTRGTLSLPGALGGANWEGGAYDPETGVLYVASHTSPWILALAPDPERSDMRYVMVGRPATGPQRLPLIKPPWGRITAIDLRTGEHAWTIPNGDTPRSVREHPALAGVALGPTGKPTRAGILVTRTLLFAGEGFGGDPVFRAYDKRTGAVLATIELPAAQSGLPMTYMAGGRQYIVMAVGGARHAAEFVALALPGPP